MSLTEYRRKRRFDKTREPEPGKPVPKASGRSSWCGCTTPVAATTISASRWATP